MKYKFGQLEWDLRLQIQHIPEPFKPWKQGREILAHHDASIASAWTDGGRDTADKRGSAIGPDNAGGAAAKSSGNWFIGGGGASRNHVMRHMHRISVSCYFGDPSTRCAPTCIVEVHLVRLNNFFED